MAALNDDLHDKVFDHDKIFDKGGAGYGNETTPTGYSCTCDMPTCEHCLNGLPKVGRSYPPHSSV